jgi:hypothetical protein
MPTNDFLAFAIAPGANVATQADWLADPVVQGGFVAGLLYSAKTNKAFRQSSFVASAVADLICRNTGNDALDNGDFGTFVAELENAIRALGGGTGGPSGGIPEAPIDGQTYGRQNELWIAAVPLAGNVVMTGPLTLSGDPSFATEAATKNYADSKLPLAGGTMNGTLTLHADPTTALGAATKQYADTKLALAGGTLTGALTAPKLAVQVASGTAEVDLGNGAAPIAAGGLWRTTVGSGGGFSVQMNTAAAGDFSTQIGPLSVLSSGNISVPYNLTVSGRSALMQVDFGASQASRTGYVDGSAGNMGLNGFLGVGGNLTVGSPTVGAKISVQGPGTAGASTEIDLFNASAGITTGQLWRMALGSGGNLSWHMNTAAAGDFSTTLQPLQTRTDGSVVVGGLLTATGATLNGAGGAPLQLNVPAATDNHINFTGSRSWLIGLQGLSNPGEFWIYDSTVSALRIQITTAGACLNTTGTWAAVSDRRLKTDIAPYERGLEAVLRLDPVRFRHTGKAGFVSDDFVYGLIADDVAEVIPEFVGEISMRLDPEDADPTPLRTLDTGFLTYVLINAVKDLAGQVAALKEGTNGTSPGAA